MDTTLLITIISGGWLTAIVGAILSILTYRDNKKSKSNETVNSIYKTIKDIDKRVESIEKTNKELQLDTTRLQLTQAMTNTPENLDTIEKIAERYFVELGGNWYMDAEFVKWAEKQGVPLPKWFKSK